MDTTDIVEVLRWLASLAPTRLTGGDGERIVQESIADRLRAVGYRIDWQPFRFPRHIYGSLALHFGLPLLLAAAGFWHPILAAGGLVVVALSFVSEAARRRHALRAIWPRVATRNLLATWPARSGATRRRLVFCAHTDSAFTGLLFHPDVIRQVAAPPPSFLPFLRKQLLLPLVCVLLLAAFELARAFVALPGWPIVPLLIPPAIVFLFNAEIVLRNQPVPGAADNLTGCAAQVILAEEWARDAHPDTEIVFAFTGAEEAGTGGAAHLARAMSSSWVRAITSVVVLDTLSNGELFLLEEGELWRHEIPPDLARATREAAAAAALPEPPPYPVPAGATDALPFLVEGYRAVALTCIDPRQHTPLNYHHPSDTADRVDPGQLRASLRLAHQLMLRLGAPPAGVA
jgi:hypothetical protein